MEPQWRCRSQRNLAEPSTSGVPPPKRFGELALQRKIIRHEFFPYVTATAGRNIPPCCLRERATTGSFPDIHPSLKVARNPADGLVVRSRVFGAGLFLMKPAEYTVNDHVPVPARDRNPMKARLPIGNLEDSEDWNASLRAVQKAVPPMHWQIFERYLMENLSSRQVAEEFQTTHFNVRVISHRIRKRVQEHLELLRGSDSNDGTGGRTGSTAPTSVPPLPATGTR